MCDEEEGETEVDEDDEGAGDGQLVYARACCFNGVASGLEA